MARIENIIINEITKGCKRLNLQPIKVKFNSNGDIAFALNLNNQHRYITIETYTILNDTKINNNVYAFKKFKLNSISKRIKFIIYHEIGHYLQFSHHRTWYIRELVKDEYILSSNTLGQVKYRQLKSESIADRIALYLLKKEND